MNAITTEILTVLLKDLACWEPVRENRQIVDYKLKLNYVYEQLRLAKEALFYDQVLFPRTQRILRLIKKMDIGHLEWVEMEVGMSIRFKIWYPVDTAWQDCFSDYFNEYFQIIWDRDEWSVEPTEAEMLALNIRPGTLDAVQKKLF